MKRGLWMFVIITAVAAGVGSFWVTTAVGQGRGASGPQGVGRIPGAGHVARWLGLSRQQAKAVREADPGFVKEAQTLRRRLNEERKAFAALLEDDASSDEQVMGRLEKVIQAQSRLERRVAEHLLKVRSLLNPAQRRRLFRLAASGVRRHGRGGFRGGQAPPAEGRPRCRGAETRPGDRPPWR